MLGCGGAQGLHQLLRRLSADKGIFVGNNERRNTGHAHRLGLRYFIGDQVPVGVTWQEFRHQIGIHPGLLGDADKRVMIADMLAV